MAPAGQFTFNGTFSVDNGKAYLTFTVPETETLIIGTTSAALGGFAPAFYIFDSFGSAFDIGNPGEPSCSTWGAPLANGGCYDAAKGNSYNAGSYTLVLTQSGNNPLGGLADGFSQDSTPVFNDSANGCTTGTLFCGFGPLTAGPSGLSSNFSLGFNFGGTVGTVTPDQADSSNSTFTLTTPEPGAVLLLLSGFAAMVVARRRK